MRFMLTLPIAALGGILAAAPVVAQDGLSVEDVLEVWQKQRAAFHEVETSGLGRTRGLELVTIDGTTAPAASDKVSVTAGSAPTDPNRPLTPAGEQVQPVVFGQLAPELQVNLQIRFAFDSAALSDDQKPKLDKICQAMEQSDVHLFRIIGHTDASGSQEYNQRLSVLRAREVASYLVEDCGIAATRLETMGMGMRFPFNAQDPRADENRRVEFQALS